MNRSYRALLARGQVRRLIAALAAAWVSFGMVALAIFLTMHRASGSYRSAGVAVAAFSLGSGALAPFRGRLLDRRGTRPWLVVFASGYGVALLAFVALARANAGSWALIACAGVGGALAPPLVASIRALWSSVVQGALVRPAYALTSVVADIGLVVAPALCGLLFVVVSWLPLVLCAIGAVAAALVVAQNARPAPDRARQPAVAARLLTGGFAAVMAVEIALGVALGMIEVAVPTVASTWGVTSYSGFLLGAFAFGSVLGGLWFGRRTWTSSPERRYLVAAFVLAVALVPPIAATDAATLAPLLVISGLAYGPATISLFEVLDSLAPSRATEAFTWITTAGALGGAAGSAASGWVTTSLGLSASFVTASLTLALAAAFGVLQRSRSPSRYP